MVNNISGSRCKGARERHFATRLKWPYPHFYYGIDDVHLATLFQENARKKEKKRKDLNLTEETASKSKVGLERGGCRVVANRSTQDWGCNFQSPKRYPVPEKGLKMIEKWGPFCPRVTSLFV